MRYKALTAILTMVFIFNLHLYHFSADDLISPEISSPAAILIETDRGQIIYKKGTEMVFRSCLSTVIMSAIVMIETQDKPSTVTITSILNEIGDTTVELSIGEKRSFNDLLHIMMLECATDIAVVLADSIYENLDAFIARMNDKSVSLGLQNTDFALSSETNPGIIGSSNADDLSKLLVYCLKNSTFKSIFTTKIFLWPVNDNENAIIANSNDLLWSEDNVTGGMKSASQAGRKQTVVTTANINNLNLLFIVTDDYKSSQEDDTSMLLRYASDNYRRGILASKGSPITEIEVNGIKLLLSPNTDIYYTYPVGQAFVEKVYYSIPEDVELPVTRNVPIGTATYHLADETIIAVKLYPDKEIFPESGFFKRIMSRLKEHRELFNIALFLLAVEIIIIIHRIAKKLLINSKSRNQ